MSDPSALTRGALSGPLLRFCAVAGWGGAFFLALAVLVAPFFVPNYNWIADTISDLGAGENEWIVDIGLYGYAGGLMCLGLGAAHAHPGGAKWSVAVLCLMILGALVVIIGARNEYGDGDSDGVVIHVYLVYGLGLGFALAPFLMANSVARRRWFQGLGAAWIVTAPVFFFLPTGWDGAYERGLGGIAMIWSSLLAVELWRTAQKVAR